MRSQNSVRLRNGKRKRIFTRPHSKFASHPEHSLSCQSFGELKRSFETFYKSMTGFFIHLDSSGELLIFSHIVKVPCFSTRPSCTSSTDLTIPSHLFERSPTTKPEGVATRKELSDISSKKAKVNTARFNVFQFQPFRNEDTAFLQSCMERSP